MDAGRGAATEDPPLAWSLIGALAVLRFAVPLAASVLAPIGYTADELYYLACADHLAWGYVDHPPLSIGVLWAVRALLGDSLLALRLVPALSGSLAVLVTAALARELGGGARAQLLAALCFATAPIALAIGYPFSMNPLEHLLWPLAALVLARLGNGGHPRLWPVLGVVLGLALENKLGTVWLCAGFAIGVLASPARGWLRTRGPFVAAGLALLLLAPHLGWQLANGWPTLEFVRNNAAGRTGLDAAVVAGSPLLFALSQLLVMGPLAAPLWLVGLVHLLRSSASVPPRLLGWAFVGVFATVALSGRGAIYYLVGAFPIVLAGGGVALERLSRERVRWLPTALCVGLGLQAGLLLPFLVPVLPVDAYLALARDARGLLGADEDAASLPPAYAWMLGGPELADAVGRAVGTLAEGERLRAGVLATTFGEAGALVRYGPAAGLPPVIATHNSFWLWGTRGLDGSVLIVVADPGSPALERLGRCQLVDRVRCPRCEPPYRDRPVFVCRDPERPLPELWAGLKDFV